MIAAPASARRFAPGDYVYYSHRTPDGHIETIPARVLKAGPKRVTISGDFLDGDRTARVAPANLQLQSETE